MDPIKLDDNIPYIDRKPRKRKEDPRAAQLLAMDIDTGKNSFFMPDKTKKDVRSLVSLGKRIGVTLKVIEFALGEDPLIKDKAGVRVWRISPPPEDF